MHSSSLRLGLELSSRISRDVQDTKDQHERWFDVKVRKGNKLAIREGIGQEFDIIGGVSEGYSFTLREQFISYYFDDPTVIFSHTHPKITKDDLDKFDKNSFRMRGENVSINEVLKYVNAQTTHFSSGDLHNIEISPRYMYSLGLATEEGIRILIREKLELPLFVRHAESRKYDARMNMLGGNLLDHASTGSLTRKTIVDYHKKADDILLDFCRSAGFVLYGNDDPSDQKLHRINN